MTIVAIQSMTVIATTLIALSCRAMHGRRIEETVASFNKKS